MLIISSIGPLKIREVWMLRRIFLIAGIISTLMTPAVALTMAYKGVIGRDTGMSTPMGITFTCLVAARGGTDKKAPAKPC